MAEQQDQSDRTEEPTQRKLEEAINKGNVAKSQEISTLFVLGGFALATMLVAPSSAGILVEGLTAFLRNAHQVPSDGAGILAAARHAGLVMIAALAVPFVVFIFAGLMGAGLQHRPLWATEMLLPKLERISPISGFKRIFGADALVNFLKGLFKIAIVGAIAAIVLWGEREKMEGLVTLDPRLMAPVISAISLKLLGAIIALFFFVAVADAIYQRFAWLKRQRMSRREIKEEFKQSEGSPEIRAKQRQIRMERARRRMMEAVPSATVVITNPTHYAVALKYEPGMTAPVCVAKGVDALALRIRERAREHDVPIVENPPLARALHASVELDAQIPVDHFAAVAEVIGYVLRLRRRRA